MKYLLTIVIFQIITVSVLAQSIQMETANKLMEEAMKKDYLPSLSVAVMKEDKVVFAKALGYADLENNVAATTESVYRIGSISKSITAVLIMALQEKGKLNINSQVQLYCADFPEKEFPITVKQLLCHQGGIRNYKSNLEDRSTIHYASSQEAIRIFKNDSLIVKPGTEYKYSTFGYTLLGCAIEGVVHDSYENALKQYVLNPSGMVQTTLDDFIKVIPHRVHQYWRGENNTWINTVTVDLSNKYPGGGILSTPIELTRFGNTLLEGKLINLNSLEALWESQKNSNGVSTNYGLGWRVSEDQNEVFHGGSSTGGESYLYIQRDKKIVVAFMTNSDGWSKPRHKLAQQLAEVFE